MFQILFFEAVFYTVLSPYPTPLSALPPETMTRTRAIYPKMRLPMIYIVFQGFYAFFIASLVEF